MAPSAHSPPDPSVECGQSAIDGALSALPSEGALPLTPPRRGASATQCYPASVGDVISGQTARK
jgi:hypothetical protein